MDVHLAAGCYDGSVCGFNVGDLQRGELILEYGYTAHTGSVRAVALDGWLMMTASADDTVKIYNVAKKKEIGSVSQHTGAVNCASLFHHRYAVTGGEDGFLCVWRCRDWELLRKLRAHKKMVTDAVFHPEEPVAISVGGDRKLKLWDLANAREAFRTVLTEDASQVQWMGPNGERFALSHNTTVSVYASDTGAVVKELTFPARVLSMRVISKNRIAVGLSAGGLKVCDLRTGRSEQSLEGLPGRIRSIACVGKIMFAANNSGSVQGWVAKKTVKPFCEVAIPHKRVTTIGAGAWPTGEDRKRSRNSAH